MFVLAISQNCCGEIIWFLKCVVYVHRIHFLFRTNQAGDDVQYLNHVVFKGLIQHDMFYNVKSTENSCHLAIMPLDFEIMLE